MASSADYFLKNALGEDFLQSLSKSELWKPATKSTNDIEDMRIGLKIVPRIIMSFLVKELIPMSIGQNKEIKIPGIDDAILQVTKLERDQYSGEINHENKKVTDFKFRSIPSLGLVIMSAFELYEDKYFDDNSSDIDKENDSARIQRLIDERLDLHDLIGKVVNKKLMEKDAIHQLVLKKLSEMMEESKAKNDAIEMPHPAPVLVRSENIKKKRPLAAFLEKSKKKHEYSVVMAKGEVIDCSDCGKNIFNGIAFSGCICLGDDMEKKIFIKKEQDGIKVRFSKGWDEENIEMLLEILRKKRG